MDIKDEASASSFFMYSFSPKCFLEKLFNQKKINCQIQAPVYETIPGGPVFADINISMADCLHFCDKHYFSENF